MYMLYLVVCSDPSRVYFVSLCMRDALYYCRNHYLDLGGRLRHRTLFSLLPVGRVEYSTASGIPSLMASFRVTSSVHALPIIDLSNCRRPSIVR